MPAPIRRTALLLTATALLTSGCSGAHLGGAPSPTGRKDCVLVPAVGRGNPSLPDSTDETVVALRDRVDATDAPSPRNRSERLVFRQMYETLVNLDCRGRVRPGLATAWSHDADGRRWTFTLRPDARFWDGTPVSAWAVAQGWAPVRAGSGAPGQPSPFDSVSVLGEHRLAVVLARPTKAAATFADDALAVTGSDSYAGWPLGSGPYRPLSGASTRANEIRVRASGAPEGVGTIVFRTEDRDARTALDAGADVLVSSDPEVLAYARALPDVTTVPLTWSRTYVVAAAYQGDEAASAPPSIPADTLERLARGAVRVSARAATPPFWWQNQHCPTLRAPPAAQEAGLGSHAASTSGPPRNIVYPEGDAVARGIAERLVGLAGPGSSGPTWVFAAVPGLDASPDPPVAVGLAPALLPRAARDGGTLALVVPLPRIPAGTCLDASGEGVGDIPGLLFSPTASMRVTPLLDVRSSLVVRSGVGGIDVDGWGTIVFHPRPVAR